MLTIANGGGGQANDDNEEEGSEKLKPKALFYLLFITSYF